MSGTGENGPDGDAAAASVSNAVAVDSGLGANATAAWRIWAPIACTIVGLFAYQQALFGFTLSWSSLPPPVLNDRPRFAGDIISAGNYFYFAAAAVVVVVLSGAAVAVAAVLISQAYRARGARTHLALLAGLIVLATLLSIWGGSQLGKELIQLTCIPPYAADETRHIFCRSSVVLIGLAPGEISIRLIVNLFAGAGAAAVGYGAFALAVADQWPRDDRERAATALITLGSLILVGSVLVDHGFASWALTDWLDEKASKAAGRFVSGAVLFGGALGSMLLFMIWLLTMGLFAVDSAGRSGWSAVVSGGMEGVGLARLAAVAAPVLSAVVSDWLGAG